MTIRFPADPFFFVGRDNMLMEIEQILQKKSHVAITGMGGLGKTALARKYYTSVENAQKYDYFGWIEIQQEVAADFVRQFDIDVNYDPTDDTFTRFSKLCKQLKEDYSNTFLIVDNMNNPDDPCIQYLRALPLKILTTSRSPIYGFEQCDLGFLDDQYCKDLFIYHYSRSIDCDQALHEIFERTGRHTLLIEMVASIARAEFWTVTKLLTELKNEGFYFAAAKETGVRSEWSYGAEVKLLEAIERLLTLSKLSEDEKSFLGHLALFSPIPITIDILKKLLPRESWKVLSDLKDKGWLQGDDRQGFWMHPLAREVVRKNLSLPYTKCTLLIDWLIWLLISIENQSILANRELILHVASVLTAFEKEETIAIGKLAHDTANLIMQLGLYSEALKWQEKSTEIFEKVLPENDLVIATSYNNLSIIYQGMGEMIEATKWQKKAMAIRENALPMDHPDLGVSYNNMATLYKDAGEMTEALKFQEKAITIWEKVLPGDHPDLAASYCNMSIILQNMDKIAEALEFQQKAVLIWEKVLSGDHPDLATSYNNMSLIYHSMGKLLEAVKWQEKAMVIREAVLPVDHPDLAASYSNMAVIYRDLGTLAETLRWQEKAVATQEKVLPADHPGLIVLYSNMAVIYRDMGKLDDAKEWQEKAMTIAGKALAENHPDLAILFSNMSLIYRDMGKMDEAVNWQGKAQAIVRKSRPGD